MRYPHLSIAARDPTPTSPPLDGRLPAVDVVRFFTVGEVILVHATSLAVAQESLAANGVLAVAHVTRSVFLILSAFVLTYSYERRRATPVQFWKKRYPLVAVPYVVWSAVYVLAGGQVASPLHVTETFLVDLLDGGAHFHLYFLLLTFQLYLVFPTIMAALERRPHLLGRALAAAAIFQVGFDAAVHYGWRPPVLGVWLSHPSSWLPSYSLYIIIGIAAARYLDRVTSWIRAHGRVVAGLFIAALALVLCSYTFDVVESGYTPLRAGEVFQPADVTMAIAVVVGQFAFGLWVSERLSMRWLGRLKRSSDLSFGVFLAHPLILTAVLSLAGWTGVAGAFASWPAPALELIVVVGLVPLVYALSLALVAGIRTTRASLLLTGRPRRSRGDPKFGLHRATTRSRPDHGGRRRSRGRHLRDSRHRGGLHRADRGSVGRELSDL